MIVYTLFEKIYSVDEGFEAWICGAFNKKEDCKKLMQEKIKDNIKNYDYIEDTDTKNKKDFKRLFLDYQENWDNYIEYEINETEVL